VIRDRILHREIRERIGDRQSLAVVPLNRESIEKHIAGRTTDLYGCAVQAGIGILKGKPAEHDIGFARELEMLIHYKENHIGTRRVDFLIEEKISVELKAVIKLEDVHLAQAINYLEAYNLEVGLLLNFGSKSLEFKRVINSKFKSAKSINQLNQS